MAITGYGSPVTPTGAVGSIPDPAAGTVKPEYANYYGTYGKLRYIEVGSELQIRGGTENNLKIIFLVPQQKHML